MAIFELAIADEDVSRVFDAICNNYSRPDQVVNPDYNPDATVPNPNYNPEQPAGPDNPETIPDPNETEMIDNPEDQGQFVHRIVRQFLAEHVRSYELNLAQKAATEATNTSVDITDPQV